MVHISLTAEQVSGMLDYLDLAAHGMAEYGYPSADFEHLRTFQETLQQLLDENEAQSS